MKIFLMALPPIALGVFLYKLGWKLDTWQFWAGIVIGNLALFARDWAIIEQEKGR